MVLLSAHQLFNTGVSEPLSKVLEIKMGANYLTNVEQTIRVVDYELHPNAASGVPTSDLAMLKLAEKPQSANPVQLNPVNQI